MSSLSLPQPGPVELQLSEKLAVRICDEASSSGGAVPFDRYMEMALYEPALGYYSAGSHKFGREGDFITAPEVSPLYGRSVAQQLRQVLDALGTGDLLEFGAGSGVLAVDIMEELERLGSLPGCYMILELSADLRRRHQQLVEERIPHLLDRFIWLERLPESPFRGVVVANEVLDAMPVHRFRISEDGVEEAFVVCKAERLEIEWHPAGEKLREYVVGVGSNFPIGYESECNLRLASWVSSVAEVLEKGLLLLIDYGYPRSEYYMTERGKGTLMCYYRHRFHDDPLVWPGLQDITAHVDFTAVAEAGVAASLEVAGYASQSHFLLGCGIEGLLRASAEQQDAEWFQELEGLKRLTLPSEMGERFKVIGLTRGFAGPLVGFSFRDLRAQL